MLVLGLDFEMLGLDPKVHSISEVGALLWDTEAHRAVQSMGYLVQVPAAAVCEDAAMETTGLSLDLLAKYGKDSLRGLKQLLNMYDDADVICAHNGTSCDRIFLRAWMESCGITQEDFPEDKVWIDTMVDIEFPRKWNKQLTCLAAYHGFLNPFPHQALSDVMTMMTILDKYDIDTVVESAKTPVVGVMLSKIPYDAREWAKERRYFAYYHPTTKKFAFWMKVLKQNKVEEAKAEAEAAGYVLAQMKEIPEGVY
jgi:DNA polymerase-3 subunit epsilon